MSKLKKVPFLGKNPAYRFTLKNGLKCIYVKTDIAPVFSYQTWYDVGSRDEEPGYSGLAHFFEHMMFKETKNLPLGTFDKTMESHGARDLNAFTSTDYTAYVQSLPKQNFSLVAKLESERMSNLLVTQDQFVSEREVVRNERKQRNENNPEGQMYEELQKLAFEVHPYGRPVIGWEEDLDRMNPEDCRAFYKRYYAPNNAVVCIVGDLKPELVYKTIDEHYGDLKPSVIKRPSITQEPEQKSEKRKELPLSLQVEKVYIGYKCPSAIHEDQIALGLLGSILSTGRSSRLYRGIVDKGIALEAGAGVAGHKDPGLFYFNFTSQVGKKSEVGMKAIEEIIEELAAKGPTEEEMIRAKNKIRTEFFMGLANNSSKANFLGHNEVVLGDFNLALEEMETVKTITTKQVREVCGKYLKKQQRTVVLGVPKDE